MDILRLVYSWLCDEANGRWVMIIDNADDLGVFSCPLDKRKGSKDDVSSNTAAALLESLPQSPNGSILITSRSRDVAFRLTGSYADIIRIHPMDQVRALALLRNKLEGSFEQDDAAALAEALDYMPLAITQAAAYISQRAPHATVSRYLQDLRKGDRDRAKLLDMDIGDSRRDGTASNSIITTWQISFEHIRKERPSATRLLSLMSLFNPQGIPESLLNSRYQDNNTSSDFNDDLNTITSFSLVATSVDGHQFKMHRLVQFSIRKWLELRGEMEGWREKYVTLMDDSYPVGRHENWKACQTLFPHAQAAITCRPTDGDALEAWASVLFKAAWYASEIGNYHAAEEMGRGALEAREATLGAEHPDTLTSISNLGLVLERQGKYEEAEAMHRQALEGYKKVLGPEHTSTLDTVNNLGNLYRNHGKLGEAEKMYQRALNGYENTLGLANAAVYIPALNTVYNLGLLFSSQGDVDRARAMYSRALAGYQRVVGYDDSRCQKLRDHASGTISILGLDVKSLFIDHLAGDIMSNDDCSTLFSSTPRTLREQIQPVAHSYEGSTALESWLRAPVDQVGVQVEKFNEIDPVTTSMRTSEGDEIKSVLSDREDILSSASSHRTSHKAVAERQIATFIADNQCLLLMFDEAMKAMLKDRFV